MVEINSPTDIKGSMKVEDPETNQTLVSVGTSSDARNGGCGGVSINTGFAVGGCANGADPRWGNDPAIWVNPFCADGWCRGGAGGKVKINTPTDIKGSMNIEDPETNQTLVSVGTSSDARNGGCGGVSINTGFAVGGCASGADSRSHSTWGNDPVIRANPFCADGWCRGGASGKVEINSPTDMKGSMKVEDPETNQTLVSVGTSSGARNGGCGGVSINTGFAVGGCASGA